MKKKKFITAVLLSFTLLTSGCSIGGLNSVINELHGSLVGNSYTIDTYDNYGNKTLETTGKKISITGNKIETVSYDDTGKAIKGYDPASGPFGAYASLVIGRRLADHYRSQHRFDAETPLAPQTFDGTVDRESADAAMQQAVAEQMSEAKPVSAQDEIEAANTVFEKYGFAFYDLAASSPKSDKTRRSCAAAVGTLLHSPVLFASMQSAHSLPIKALAQQCGVSARTITRHRDYIVAAALLIDGDYPILCTYLQTMRKEAEQCVR